MRSSHSPSIRSRYDYYYTMSPSSTTAANSYYDNQNASLFGDPVPPSTDFLETLDTHLYGSFRRRNSDFSNSSALDDRPPREKTTRFMQRDVNLGDEIVKPLPVRGKTARKFHREESLGEEIVKPLPIREMTTRIYQRDSFDLPESSIGAANSSYVSTRRRSSSNFSDDIRLGTDYRNNNDLILSPSFSTSSPPKRIFPTQPLYLRRPSNESMETRRPSNDSNMSNDWSNNSRTRPPTVDEWSRIPRPVTALRKPMHNEQNVSQPSGLMSVIQSSASSTFSSEDEKPAPRSRTQSAVQRVIPIQPHELAEPSHLVPINPDDSENDSHVSLTRELSPIVVRDTINTGSAYRAQSPKNHLKSSFTIINELKQTSRQSSRAPSRQSSQAPSRAASPPYAGRVSPFLGKGFKPHSRASSRTTSRAASPSQFDPQTFTDSLILGSDPLRPTVQFNMSGSPDRGTMTPNHVPKGILQRRGIQYMSNQELSFNDPDNDTDEFERPIANAHPRPRRTSTAPNMKVFQVLPQLENIQQIGDTKKRPVHRSAGELYKGTQSAGARPSVNPTRYQRGVMRVVSSANNSPSRIPILAGPSVLLEAKQLRRGSVSPASGPASATSSPKRESFRVAVSIETGGNVTKRPSRPGSRVAKPTTLSPIVGTPNRDEMSGHEDDFNHTGVIQVNKSSVYTIHRPDLEDTYNTKRAKPPTGIPSRAASRANSRSGSRLNSREPTPTSSKSPAKPKSKIPQKAERSSSLKRTTGGSETRDSSIKRTGSKKGTTTATTSSKISGSKSKPGDSKSKKMETTNSVKKASTSTKKEPPLKRETSNLKKAPSFNLKREASNLKREPSNLKREPSSLKREPSNLKREPSNLKKTPSGELKREPSNLKRTPSNLTKREGVKREGSNMSLLSKKSSEQSLTGKKLQKKPSFNNKKDKNGNGKTESEENKQSNSEMEPDSLIESSKGDAAAASTEKDDKLVPMTKAQVVSMTTAAIASQPVQITTTINNQLNKTNSSGSLLSQAAAAATAEAEKAAAESDDAKTSTPTPAILEKTQKTLENIQKTVNEATDEIQKTLEENLTDLKSLQNDMMGGEAVGGATPTPLEKKESSKSLKDKLSDITEKEEPPGSADTKAAAEQAKVNNHLNVGDSDETAERVSERAISVPPEVELESGNLQQKTDNKMEAATAAAAAAASAAAAVVANDTKSENNNKQNHTEDRPKLANATEHVDDIKPASPEPGSEPSNPNARKGCCPSSKCSACCGPCCTRLCIPCRRLKALNCFKRCRRDKTATNAEKQAKMADTKAEPKESCWKRLNCCKRKKKEPASGDEPMAKKKINETAEGAPTEETQKRGKCRLCLDKFFCCKRTNKIETMEKSSTMKEMTSSKSKCCSSSCFPCRRKAKPKEATAWTEHGEVVEDMMPAKLTCWQRVKDKLLCCRKKETRRTSMASKKQSLAPTIPPEDKRKKLDNVLVEHGSMMKGAIPVLPVCLAWFCLICNCLVPGLGTIISGLLCLCIGVPRFSQFDGARPRIGSFVINCIVGVAQAFCILFCLVGWGWSIWWGTIMLKMARKRKKIRDAEAYEVPSSTNASNAGTLQAPAATAATAAPANANVDVEAGKS